MWPAAAYASIQLLGALLPDSPLTGEADGDTPVKGSQPDFLGGTQWGHRMDRHWVSMKLN